MLKRTNLLKIAGTGLLVLGLGMSSSYAQTPVAPDAGMTAPVQTQDYDRNDGFNPGWLGLFGLLGLAGLMGRKSQAHDATTTYRDPNDVSRTTTNRY
jgi:hypothetical protein